MSTRLQLLVIPALPMSLAAAAAASTATFTPLGHLPGAPPESHAVSVSHDGQYVGGVAPASGPAPGMVPLIWDGTTPETLTVPPDFLAGAGINAISGDGQSAVGMGLTAEGFRGVRWDATGTPYVLPSLPNTFSSYNAINYDGSALGGHVNHSASPFGDPHSEAVIWTATDGLENLGDIPGKITEGNFSDVTSDGTTFVGHGHDGVRRAVTWDAENGFQVLPGADPSNPGAMAAAIAPSGGVIVGAFKDGFLLTPAYWDNDRNAHSINLWPEYVAGIASDTTDDGLIIIGTWQESKFPDYYSMLAFIWDPVNGTRPLQDVLADEHNLDLGGWTLTTAAAITPDGTTIVGTGINPSGELEAYKVSLSADPGIVGDLNGDGVVDVFDLLILLGSWGMCAHPDNCPADLNGDRIVDVFDLLILLGNWS